MPKAKKELNFHVLRVNKKPTFCYVGTPEEASIAGAELQKKVDADEGVKSSWKRKKVVDIVSVEGQIGPESLERIVKDLKQTVFGIDYGGDDKSVECVGQITPDGNLEILEINELGETEENDNDL